MSLESHKPSTGRSNRYEERDVDLRTIMIYAGALLIMIGGVVLVALSVWRMPSGAAPPAVSSPNPMPATEPRLETDPDQNLRSLRQKEHDLLDQYAWVDRSHGIVRIPIARAIDLLTEQGLPARPAKEKQP